MLVLSRRPGQKIVFPGLGISIEILKSKGTATRLGIEAPADIEIHRQEVIERIGLWASDVDETCSRLDRESRHELNNRLNSLTLKLQLLQRQLAMGTAIEPGRQIADVVARLSDLELTIPDCHVADQSPKVLIIEDQANERELLANCLQLSGIQVSTAVNGREAFNLLHESEMPDLVLLDMRMPELDGPSFIKLIRDDFRLHTLRVFAVSGSTREEFSSTLPVDGWFSKPVRIDSLLEAMRDPACAATTLA
jgi:carbon storage regulator CsrA